ncbi:MAG TPA: FAD-binding oxidoreductase [Actinophytocola sp.]|uniref:FAD-binding oxidoreductase n=1 Tax=Actinophytocola sp. TaxID=1872138 RepID=UPI002DB55B65|nr:FAD-binding oxidoreductase [Actinophytocola sp.]HEU5474881.1 FAD-binding oxidoreductase [Actinophytocola sp.]
MVESRRKRSWWGWGWVDAAATDAERAELVARLPPGWAADPVPVPRIADLALRPPRIVPPGSLAPVCSTDPEDRAGHTYGKSYRDVVRALAGDLPNPPDLVARPRTEADVIDLLDWACSAGVAVIPYGGGSSVVGGVEYRGGGHDAVLSMDLTGLDQVLEVDRISRAARIQAGALGPVLERQLGGHGLTLRHFPQSFEFSTLGGWLATRAGGHYATRHTHIDDFVESLRVVTPVGVSESRRLPASGAGPSPDRLFLGSEGAIGVITEAWLRVMDRPVHKASAGVRFDTFGRALAGVRAIAQSGLEPSNCRLLDAAEAAINAGVTDGSCLLVLGFESADHPVDTALDRALRLATDHGGTYRRVSTRDGSDQPDAVDAWRSAFLRMPYLRDTLARLGVIVETFETACTWDRAERLCEEVRAEVGAAIGRLCRGPGIVTCRLTHVYPDGVAPYFTVLAKGRSGAEVSIWDEIKSASSEALMRLGATITHHHAVGRDHKRWYERQRPDPFGAALRAVKKSLDPSGILNPGVLFH